MAKRATEMGITSELRNFLHASPFRAFDIKTTDGDTFHVFHPDFCMISPSGQTAVLYERGDAGHRVVNLKYVVSMEPSRPRKGIVPSGKR